MVSDEKIAATSYLASLVAAPLALAAFTKENKFTTFAATATNITFTRIIYNLAQNERERIRGTFLPEKQTLVEKLSSENLLYGDLRARKRVLGGSAVTWGVISALTLIKSRSRNRPGFGIDGGSNSRVLEICAGLVLSWSVPCVPIGPCL